MFIGFYSLVHMIADHGRQLAIKVHDESKDQTNKNQNQSNKANERGNLVLGKGRLMKTERLAKRDIDENKEVS